MLFVPGTYRKRVLLYSYGGTLHRKHFFLLIFIIHEPIDMDTKQIFKQSCFQQKYLRLEVFFFFLSVS